MYEDWKSSFTILIRSFPAERRYKNAVSRFTEVFKSAFGWIEFIVCAEVKHRFQFSFSIWSIFIHAKHVSQTSQPLLTRRRFFLLSSFLIQWFFISSGRRFWKSPCFFFFNQCFVASSSLLSWLTTFGSFIIIPSSFASKTTRLSVSWGFSSSLYCLYTTWWGLLFWNRIHREPKQRLRRHFNFQILVLFPNLRTAFVEWERFWSSKLNLVILFFLSLMSHLIFVSLFVNLCFLLLKSLTYE